jgi:Subtilase family
MSESEQSGIQPLDDEQMRERTRIQIRIIQESLGEDAVGVDTGDSDDIADFLYLYRRKHILVRDADVDRVRAALDNQADVAVGLVNGLTRLVLTTDDDVPAVLDRLDASVGIGVATPDHVLYVTRTGGSCCPATEPLEPGTRQPFPAVNTVPRDGRGVLVSVVDTGWHQPAASHPDTPWLADVTGDPETIDPANIQTYGGHGTFIAGLVKCTAPAATVRVEGFLPTGGAVFESDMTVQLCEALALGPDVISLSAGAKTRADRPTLSFEVFWDNFLSQVKGTVLVAAAGNDATRVPFWPAAFPWTVSVGAMDGAGRRSSYSNFGSWVDV